VILSVTEQELMRLVRDEIVQKNLSVRQAEELAKKLKRKSGKATTSSEKGGKQKISGEIPESYCQTLTNDISRRLESNARIIQNGSRGKIEIEYYSLDDLERLVNLIASN
jgi:ParB family chromosome partitioning protein